MPDKPKFSKEEFLRRERDILKKHRMPADMKADLAENPYLKMGLPGSNGNGNIEGMV